MRTHILIECETYVQTALMAFQQFEEFETYGEIEVRIKLTKDIRPIDLEWSDIVYSIRGQCLLSTYIAKLCKKYKRIHVTLLDDNLFLHRRTDVFMVIRKKELANILNETSILFTVNELLADKIAQKYSVSRFVHADTAVLEQDIRKRSLNTGMRKRLVYYSNDGTSEYFKKVFVPIFSELKKNFNDELEIHCIGMKKSNINYDGVSIIFASHMSLEDFRKYLAEGGFNVGIAPLVKNDGFSQYKYFNKYLEFSMAGIPGIYSNVSPYDFIIKDGINGYLCGDNPIEWVNAIKILLSDRSVSDRIVENAQNQLRSQFSPKGVYNNIVRQFKEYNSFKAPKVKIMQYRLVLFKYFLFVFGEKINSVYRALKKGGIKQLIYRTNEYFKMIRQSRKTRNSF